MKNLLVRIVYAAICVVMLLLILPLFLSVIGFVPAGNLLALLRLSVACLAVIYVIWGPPPPLPW
jgi:hypothetical protein